MMEIDVLRRLVSYNPETGELNWNTAWPDLFGHSEKRSREYRCKIWNAANAGKLAFCTDNGKGYLCGRFLGFNYKAHRVAWAHYHGHWPEVEVDHVNHKRNDNRIENLRLVNKAGNQQNASLRHDNTSGYTGITWCKRDAAWVVQIQKDGKRMRKNFKSFEDAKSFRNDAYRRHGFHQNHGLPPEP